jgi:Tfp pilus assembly protein PilO
MYAIYTTWVTYDEHVLLVEQLNAKAAALALEIVAAEKKVGELEEFVRKSNEYKLRVEEVAKNIEAVQKQLPSETNDSQVISYFQSEINALNLKEADLTPGREQKSTYFISKDYSMKAKGTFLQFLIFFERVASADRLYNIQALKLYSTNERQRGRFQMLSGEGTIQAFRFNPEFRVERGF